MHDLPTILLSYGVELKQRGEQYIAKCIAHDDHNPSMSVYINGTGKYTTHCFSCGFHEDAIGVVAHMENVTQAKAAELLGDPTFEGKGRYAKIIAEPGFKKPERTMLIPPADAPVPKMGWLVDKDTGEPFGEPVAVGIFRTAEGNPLMYEARYIVNGKKEPRVFSYGRRGSAPEKWECSHHMPPRPIYGLDKVAALKGQVAVFEGYRKAEYAQGLITSIACTAWTGGAMAWTRSDWTPIAGRTVLLFPDADEPGRKAMKLLAQHLIGLGCTVHVVDDISKSDGWDICDVTWTGAEFMAWAKANKGQKMELAEPEPMPEPEPEDEYTPPPVEAYISDGIVWTPPQDVFSELLAPQIKPEMVPEAIRHWMIDTAPIVGVDPSILALSAIVCSAAVMHDGIKLQPEKNNPGWTESARLWGAIVGDSSIKKSPALKRAKSRLEKIQIELSRQASDIEDDYKSKEMAYEIQRKEYIKNLAAKKEDNPKPVMAELPEIPRLIASDVTVEKLSDLLRSNPRGIFIDKDELSGFFGAMDAYKNGAGGSDRAAWLESYNGGPRYIDRVGRGSTFVPNWSCSMLGGIQPDAMRKIVDKLPEDGLLQRFMIVQGRPGKEGNEAHYSKEANDRYKNMLDELYQTNPAQDAIHLSHEANEIRKEMVRHAYKLMEGKMISPGFCSWLGKTEGLTARLLLTYHGIECADRKTHPNSHYISAETASMVRDLWRNFLLPHAIAFYINIVGFSEVGKHVKKIAELCLTSETNEISNREFIHGWIGWRHIKDWDQQTVIQQLIDQGWILPHPLARQTNKGFPTRFLINPELSKYHATRKAQEKERRAMAADAIEAARGN